jgi:hypothetical protein
MDVAEVGVVLGTTGEVPEGRGEEVAVLPHWDLLRGMVVLGMMLTGGPCN